MIDTNNNKEIDIETRTFQSFLISQNLFLISISRVFNKISKTSPLVISLLFVDNLGFIALGSFIKGIGKVFEKVIKEILKWKKQNTVIYNTSKSKAVIFYIGNGPANKFEK